jgi:hypothetical protein
MDNNFNNDNPSTSQTGQTEVSNKNIKTTPAEDKFQKDAEKTVNRLIKDFNSLSELSIKHKGAYTDEHIDQIFKAIRKKVENTRKSFKMQDDDEDNFTFE